MPLPVFVKDFNLEINKKLESSQVATSDQQHALLRRSLIIGTAGACLLSGCSGKPVKADRKYVEEVSSIFVTADSNKIVFMGKNFTYIFNEPGELLATFRSSFYSKVRAYPTFIIDGASIEGDITLELTEDATEEDKQAAKEAGYIRRSSQSSRNAEEGRTRTYYTYSRSISLRGRIYGATDMGGVSTQKLNQTYHVTINDVTSVRQAPEKSPIQEVAKGVFLLGALPLMLVLVAFGGLPMGHYGAR